MPTFLRASCLTLSGLGVIKIHPSGGAVAQLEARLDGIEEVVGSNPIGSTKLFFNSTQLDRRDAFAHSFRHFGLTRTNQRAYVLLQSRSTAWRRSMSKHDSSRRSFLVRAAVGAGAVAGSGLVPDAYTQTVAPHKDSAAVPGQSHPTSIQHGA